MTSRSLHLTALLCLLLAPFTLRPACAIGEAKPLHLDPKPIKLITRFCELDKTFPKSLSSNGDVYTVVYATASSLDVYVLAPQSLRPQELARALQQAIKDTSLARQQVYYMQTKDYSWADVWRDHPRPWSRSMTNEVPLHSVLTGLQRAGLKPHTILCELNGTKPSHRLGIRGYSGKRSKAFSVTAENPRLNFELRARVSSTDIVRILVAFLTVPAVCIPALVALLILAPKRRTTPEGRRTFVTARYTWLTIVCMAVGITCTSSLLTSGSVRTLLDMWFGDQSILGIPLLVMTSLLFLPIGTLAAQIAFRGRTEGRPTQPWYRRSSWLGFIPFLVVFLALGHVQDRFPPTSLLVRHQFFVVFVLWLILEIPIGLVRRTWCRLTKERASDVDLLAKLSPLASSMATRLNKVEVVVCADKSRRLIRIRRGGVLQISRPLVDELSPEEIAFLASHEFTHAERHDGAKKAFMLYVWTAFTIVSVVLFAISPLGPSPRNWMFWIAAAAVTVMLLEKIWLGHRREEHADLTALAATRNPQAACQAVMKASGLIDAASQTPDKINTQSLDFRATYRVRWLKKTAEQMGLDCESALGRREQDDSLTARTQELAFRMGVRIGQIEIMESATSKPVFNAAALLKGRIAVGRALLEGLAPEELDFALAHELAHIKYRHIALRLSAIFGGAALLLGGMLLSSLLLVGRLQAGNYGLWVVIVGGLLMASGPTLISRATELVADRAALRQTRNLSAAISALTKIAAGNPLEIPEELEDYRTHPKIAFRLEALRKEARKLGISELATTEHYDGGIR